MYVPESGARVLELVLEKINKRNPVLQMDDQMARLTKLRVNLETDKVVEEAEETRKNRLDY